MRQNSFTSGSTTPCNVSRMSIQKQMKEPFHVIEINKGEFLSAEENELYRGRKKSVQRLSWEIFTDGAGGSYGNGNKGRVCRWVS